MRAVPRHPIPQSLLHHDVDESGEPRLIARHGAPTTEPPRTELRVLAIFDETPAVRRFAFRNSPFCVHCGTELSYPEEGNVVPTDEGPRLACRASACYAAAMSEHNPDLRIHAAIGVIHRAPVA